jgi:hypothetical protein
MVEDLIERLRRADLSAINKACEILAGLPQDAIDGGWTARGISAYAKRLEGRLTALESERDALLAAAGKEAVKGEPVGEIIAADPVLGWHFRPYIGWEQIGAGTKLYTAPTAALGNGDGRDAKSPL